MDQSVLEVALIDEVKEQLFQLVGTLRKEIKDNELTYRKPKQNALLLAHWETQSYNGEVFVDLFDFCQRLEVRYKDVPTTGDVIKYCGQVRDAIANMVVRSCVAGAAFQFSYGLSIYFPWAVLSPRYGNLSFPNETKWIDFLKEYHDVTRRPSRNQPEPPPDRKDTEEPGRASIPTNKGRDGRVESMRNPPNLEFTGCENVDPRAPLPAGPARSTRKKRSTKKR